MKKKLLILAVAGFALASCSSDETTASLATSEANEINFRPLMTGLTRAADVDEGNGTYGLKTIGFTVFADESGTTTQYFPETAFEWDNTNNSYRSSSKYYWPSAGSLDFFGYAYSAPANHDTQVTHTARTKAFTVTPDANAQYQTDLIIACTTGKSKSGTYATSKTYGKDGVPFNFRHAETKVTIKLQNTSTDFDISVGNVILGNVFTTGTYTFSGSTDNGGTPTITTNTDDRSGYWLKYDDWSSQASLGTYTQASPISTYTSATAITSLTNPMILIPQTLTTGTAYNSSGAFDKSYIQVQLKIQDKVGHYIIGAAETYENALWPLPATKWLPGHHYTYTLNLAGGGYKTTGTASGPLEPILEGAEIIFVSVTVDGWGTPTNTDVNMN